MEILNEMTIDFLSKSQNEAFARVVVAAFASQLNPTLDELADIKTAVSEAVTNCIIHGYENNLGTIRIKAILRENEIEIWVQDWGKGIEDIEKARQPLWTSKPELDRSGMGFTIMENFMDRVEVESTLGKGTIVKMYKTIKNKK
ncbi:stage II sporulation protein AB (anti-sigma F factor) [Caldanaerovirga acetigignens]|jgi:stage II sporulation protein AB (anti-sigma F factor)|uniref:Anti-sigma F factor n=1 Tax=Caldanaerovirga acetigignens TaxID=447595 RepID=A0A1M7JCQ3_9FIRM|nr:anti-sigma F factor [Caldanaerovirga acetigignens]SHM50766.1 stage II sporulation protein AB (anti-sigma F factor) [Caldanaerovirga acetigignens]